jgi:hypothetical protein
MPLSKGRRFAAFALLALGAGASCAEHIGRKASQGAVQGLKDRPPDEQLSRVAARRAVVGSVEAFDDPEVQRRMRRFVDRTVEAAVASTFDALDDPRQQERLRELITGVVQETTATTFQSLTGAEAGGAGPAAQLAAQIAQAATREAMLEVLGGVGAGLDQMFPGCAGAGADAESCRRQRLRALTREAGAGFSTGVLDAVRWPLLIATLLLGLVVGLIAHWLWTLRGRTTPADLGPRASGLGLRKDLRSEF